VGKMQNSRPRNPIGHAGEGSSSGRPPACPRSVTVRPPLPLIPFIPLIPLAVPVPPVPPPSGFRLPVLLLVLAWAVLPAGILQGQMPVPGGPPPLVQEVSFEGADALSSSTLETWIATQPTRCRALLLRPFCLFSDGAVITERHRLDREELPRDELRLRVTYFRHGFRETSVAAEVQDHPEGVEVRFRLEEGPPTLLHELEVRQTREVLSGREIEAAGLPVEGRPLSLDALEEGMERLREELEAKGYLDARIQDTIEVRPERREAIVRVEIDPGARATVQRFDLAGNEEVEDRTILLALHLEEGDVITAPLLRRSRNALHQSNLFHEANVTVPDQPDSAKVVTVQVREAPPRLGRIGGGFSTLEFGQLEGRFSHYNWMGGGRRLDLRAGLGNLLAPQLTDFGPFHDILPGELGGVDEGPFRRPTWQLSADFQQPAFRAAENVLAFGLFSNRRIIPGISVDEGYGAELSLIRRMAFRSPLSLSYRFEITSVEAGDVFFCVNHGICELSAIESLRGRNTLSPLALSYQTDRSDDPLGPTSGYRVRLDLEHASGATLSDFRHNRVSGDASWYQPFAGPPRHVLAGRLRVGWVRSLGGTAEALGIAGPGDGLLHPRKRFFAGGARSVRGFTENQLGPRILTIPRQELLDEDGCTSEEIADRSCDASLAPTDAFSPRPIGGTSLLEANVEYRVPLGAATLAFFVDGALVGGRLGALIQEATGAVTPGVGARFPSPAGPIRIDLGYRPRAVAFLPVVTEGEAPNETGRRELVQLRERRPWDPLQDEGTLGRILGRLTLHFSIGEAF
jgi:outer membrane protein assembly factor BamA